MTDLNKLRSEFEEAYLSVGGKQRELELEDGEYTNSKAQLGWELWQIKAKDQAVPEGYCLVPKEIPDSVVSCLENSGFHWGDGTRDHYTPIYSLMVEVASESGAEG
ncbi:hypothetical protein EA758_01975 [Acinetobacter pittii]|uniref:hypothetical protein n=1 Tax=Acinetobacter pittii TaxID=48296 RepID=UPI000A354ECF|nr:hypothetical protein [Acinetobacter pittii]OTL80073.1 hypothetical protein B9X62_19920 [Acinetobacter pittii]RSO56884.1 hypothetical protein EA758_01975 [Acinetobacter pittii]